jgi:hypothetical protein
VTLQIGHHTNNNFTINWGDGTTVSTVSTDGDSAALDAAKQHTYTTTGVYTVTIKGEMPGGITFSNYNKAEYRLTEVLDPLPPEVNTDFSYKFAFCSNLTSIPEGLFDNNTLVTSFYRTFCYCSSLTGSIPAGLFDNNPLVDSFGYTFNSCSSLTSVPEMLFAYNTTTLGATYDRVFSNCQGLADKTIYLTFPSTATQSKFGGYAFSFDSTTTGSLYLRFGTTDNTPIIYNSIALFGHSHVYKY